MTTFQILNDAIGLFLEYRDKHGYDEDRARNAAVLECLECLEANGAAAFSSGSGRTPSSCGAADTLSPGSIPDVQHPA